LPATSWQTPQRYFDDSGDSTLLRGLTYVAPPNNNFVNSILLSNFLAFGSASTSGATAEPGEPLMMATPPPILSGGDGLLRKTVW